MKQLTLIFFIAFITSAPCSFAQSKLSSSQHHGAQLSRAKEGDTVWVLINHVKPDQRQQFEQFVYQTFWPMSKKLSGKDQQVFRKTRILNPTHAEADGTYSYIFIMDPLITGGDYDIDHLLKKIYGEQKGGEYGKQFDATVAQAQTQYLCVQSPY